jgi:hypothetical protein
MRPQKSEERVMKKRLFIIVWAAAQPVFGLARSEAAPAATMPLARIAVRVYHVAGVPSGNWSAATKIAEDILEGAAVTAEWRTCGSNATALTERSCLTPLDPNEFAIRIVTEQVPAGDERPVPLGYSLIDMRTGTGSLATIHPNRVVWLASGSGVELCMLLGRTIAHELGHLLLGSNDHRSVGLMRGVWSQDSLRRNTPADWTFTDADAADIHAAIRRRMMPQQFAAGVDFENR